MNVLLLGAGAVGESYAVLTRQADPNHEWLEKLVVADFSEDRAREVADRFGGGDRYPWEQVDASDQARIEEVIRKHQVDLVMNGCPQHFDEEIFDAAFNQGCHYIDMAMTLSEKHPKQPYQKIGVMLGDYQFEQHGRWEEKGRTALLAMGIDPGISNVFARYVSDELFDELDEIGVRDGANMAVAGMKYATQFSVWSVIEECLNPPVFWEKDRGHYTTQAMSEAEIFNFPEIGPVESGGHRTRRSDHPASQPSERTQKSQFQDQPGGRPDETPPDIRGNRPVIRRAHRCQGNDGGSPGCGGSMFSRPGQDRSPDEGKDMRGASTPPAARMEKTGRSTCTRWTDNEECMKKWGCQAVAIQTSVGAAIATELIAKGIWNKPGVHAPEVFDPEPVLERLPQYGFPYHIRDSWSS